MNVLRVGVARVNIDPPVELPHAGWGAQTHVFADGVDTHLHVTALYADDGQKEAVHLEYDVCLFSPEQVSPIRAAVSERLSLPLEAVRVATTHNHAGPMIEAGYYEAGQGVRDDYLRMLAYQGAGAAMWAKGAARPALVRTGTGVCTFAANRRQKLPSGRVVTGWNPDGVTDPQVSVIRVDSMHGDPITVLFSYACHATVLGPTNRILSADYPGAAKEVVLSATGAVPVFVQGAAGNVGPGPSGFTNDLAVPRKLGRILGYEVAKVYEEIDNVRTYTFDGVIESGAPLGVFRAEPESVPDQTLDYMSTILRLPVQPQPTLAETTDAASQAAARLRALQAAAAGREEIANATYRAKRTAMQLERVRNFGGAATKDVELHLLRLGPAVLAGIPGEPFAEIGLAIKQESPFPTTVFGGYTNGWLGYVPTADAYPDRGYEVDTTAFADTAAAEVVSGTIGALRLLRDRETKRKGSAM